MRFKFTGLIALVVALFAPFAMMAQAMNVSGTVTSSEDGLPMPGVSIIVVGSTNGTSTDFDGNFSIDANTGDQLQFSFIGYADKSVAVSGASMNVVLDPDAEALDEVVVTAFGITREKKSITYQTEVVSGEALNAGQSTSAATGLVGKVAGLQINVQDAGVKPNTQILLRGMRSVSGNNEALIVIDGAIATSAAFTDLNPTDIESINTLKGATAAALYGSRAANGAMIITTKSGTKNERFTAGLMHSTTFEQVQYMPDFQTTNGTGWDGVYNNIENTNWGPRFDGQNRQIGPTFDDGSYQSVPYAPVEDNLLNFFNIGSTMQNTAYLTGGDATSSFYLSIGDVRTKGIVPDDTYQKNTIRANAKKKIGSIELSTNINYSFDEKDVVGDQIGSQDRALYWFLLNSPANYPLSTYSDYTNPKSFGYSDNYANAFYQNPYWAIGTNRMNNKTNRFIGNASLSWDIVENINFLTRFGANSVSGTGKNWRASQSYDKGLQPYIDPVTSFVEDTEFQSTSYTFDMLIQGDWNFTEDLSFKAIAGSAVYSQNYRQSEIRANNLSIPGFYDVSNGTGVPVVSVDEQQKRTVGIFADLTLGYKNWAYLNLTGRQDFTSTLPDGENSYFYPSAGVSVLLHDAIPAIGEIDFISMFKLTASNSTVYNDVSPYQINERYSQSSTFPYGSINGFYKDGTAVDVNIKKEKLNSTELGLNLAFFNGRLLFDAAYFSTTTSDLITNTTPSITAGATSYLTNIGELKGSGYEFTIGGEVIKAGDFTWNLSVNAYHFETVVTEIKDGLDEIGIDVYTGYGTYAIKGEAFPQIKAVSYVRDGQGRVVIDETSGNPLVGNIEKMGKTTPDIILGLNSSINWKGLTLSTTMDYRGGFVYYSQGSDIMEFTGRSMESVSANRKDFVWPNSVVKNGDGSYSENTNIPITGGKMAFWKDHYNQIKENYVKDASAFKLREVSISYTLSKNLLAKTPFTKIRVGAVGRNLFTYFPKEKYKFSDPEFRNTRSTDEANGIGIGGYLTPPPTRSFGFSVNVEF